MSLINRMLEDLERRAPGAAQAQPAGRRGGLRGVGGPLMLAAGGVVMLAAAASGFWLMPPASTLPEVAQAEHRLDPALATSTLPQRSPDGWRLSRTLGASAGEPYPPVPPDEPTGIALRASLAMAEPPATAAPARNEPSPPEAVVEERSPLPRQAAPEPVAQPEQSADSRMQLRRREVPAADRAAEAYRNGRQALVRGQHDAAESHFREALAAHPGHAPAWLALAELMQTRSGVAAADEILDEGMASGAPRQRLLRQRARLWADADALPRAVALLREVLDGDSAEVETLGLLAALEFQREAHAEAAALYADLVQRQPGNARWWAGYALAHDAQGAPVPAAEGFRRLLELGETAPDMRRFAERRLDELAAERSGG